MVTLVKSIRGLATYFQSLVHESARDDLVTLARHQSFIGSHLLGGILALATFPVYLAAVGRPSLISALAFVWLLSPIAIAIFLSRSGRLGAAHLISAINLTGLVTFAASLTGGVTSFLVVWLIVVPLEAALSADRRIVLGGSVIACAGLVILGTANMFNFLPEVRSFSLDPILMAFLGSVSALIYAGGLAVSVQIIQRRSEDAIRQGETRYQLLADNATDMITRHNPDGEVVFASAASMQLLGKPPSTLLGDGLFERIHVADRPGYRAALDRCVAEDRQVSVEFRVRADRTDDAESVDDGCEFTWLEMRCKPVTDFDRDDRDKPSSDRQIVAVSRDVMERKIHESEILHARDAAESANCAKTQFLANMSHELRTPLNAIIGFSEILTRELFGTLGDERYDEYARLIHESGGHLLNVVNGILDMSKIEAGKFSIVTEHFDAASLVTSCCEMMGHQAGQKNINLETDLPDRLPELVADKRACKQMLLNLLSNAIKFTEEGGTVNVSLTNTGEMMEMSVADNGIGIAKDDLPTLGNPFVQAENSYNRSYEGTGLGLSVVKGLAGLHGGSLDIASTLGKGTIVTVRLPAEGIATEANRVMTQKEPEIASVALSA